MLILLLFLALAGFAIGRRWRHSQTLARLQASYLSIWLPLFLVACTALNQVDLVKSVVSSGLYYAAAGTFLAICFLLYSRQPSELDASVGAVTVAFSNTVMVGIPLFEAVQASDALALVYIMVPLHALVLFAVGTLLSATSRRPREAGETGLTVPNITYALVAGVVISSVIEHTPTLEVIREQLVTVMQVTTFLVFGVAIGCVRAADCERRLVGGLVLGKLIWMPAFVYLCFHLVQPQYARAAAIVAALPIGINTLAYAAAFGERSTRYVSQGILYSTMAGAVSVSAWLWVLGYIGT